MATALTTKGRPLIVPHGDVNVYLADSAAKDIVPNPMTEGRPK
jgi:hypothetical protein